MVYYVNPSYYDTTNVQQLFRECSYQLDYNEWGRPVGGVWRLDEERLMEHLNWHGFFVERVEPVVLTVVLLLASLLWLETRKQQGKFPFTT